MASATIRLHSPLARAREKQGRGIFARFYAALIEARTRQAMRELALHRHLLPPGTLEEFSSKATVTDDSALPFTR
jgi:hypothetical protein